MKILSINNTHPLSKGIYLQSHPLHLFCCNSPYARLSLTCNPIHSICFAAIHLMQGFHYLSPNHFQNSMYTYLHVQNPTVTTLSSNTFDSLFTSFLPGSTSPMAFFIDAPICFQFPQTINLVP